MRLLLTKTGGFKWIDNPEAVSYAILSHTWSSSGEDSYADLLALQADVHAAREAERHGLSPHSDPPLPENEVLLRASPKIRFACERALAEGYELIWIDSACIDKTHSVELSEAINSMFQWYRYAAVCYAFLEDVTAEHDAGATGSQFRRSRWFTRGWTLQELIAPRAVFFYSKEWEMLGGKDSLAWVIQEITGIDTKTLLHQQPLSATSVACRMSWAAKRVTTRKEDEAYALMGIFDIHMPTIYGEGRLAFFRLQEEILKTIPDQSLFAWESKGGAWATDFHHKEDEYPRTLLAASPADFIQSGRVRAQIDAEFWSHRDVTSSRAVSDITVHGLRATLPVIELDDIYELAILACVNDANRTMALILQRQPNTTIRLVGAPAAKFRIAGPDQRRRRFAKAIGWHSFSHPNDQTSRQGYVRVVYLPRPAELLLIRGRCIYYDWSMKRMCIVLRPQRDMLLYRRGYEQHGPPPAVQLRVRIPARCRSHLAAMGYALRIAVPSPVSMAGSSAGVDDTGIDPSTALLPRTPPVTITLGRLRSGLAGDAWDPDVVIRITPACCDCSFHGEGPEDSWSIFADVASSTGHALEVADGADAPWADSRRTTSTTTTTASICQSCPFDAHTHVESWNLTSAQKVPTRWQRFLLPHTQADAAALAFADSDGASDSDRAGDARETVIPVRLELVRDFVGDSKHPAVFSLSVRMYPAEPRARAMADAPIAQSRVGHDIGQYGTARDEGSSDEADTNSEDVGAGNDVALVCDGVARRLPVRPPSRRIPALGAKVFTRLCRPFVGSPRQA